MADFASRMAALHERFVARLAVQLPRIEACARDGRWIELGDICHVIAGGAGMFGLHALGEAAREVEEAIAGGAAPGRLQELVLHLLDEARRPPG